MPRPTFIPTAVEQQTRGWDAIIDTNFTNLKATVLDGPIPLALVYKTTPYSGATDLSTLDAADYIGCFAYLTDPATVATNGNLIYSNGTDWLYQRSGGTV